MVNEPTIDAHIMKMDRPSVWATQVEVYAASAFFQVPFYTMCYNSPTDFHWEVAKPINKEKLRFPLLIDSTEDFTQCANEVTHFEVVNLKNTHYESIVDAKSGIPSSTFPIMIPPRKSLTDLTNVVITLDWSTQQALLTHQHHTVFSHHT